METGGDQPPSTWTVAVMAAVGVGVAGVVAVFFTRLKTLVEVVADRGIAWVQKRGGGIEWTEALSFLADFNAILDQTEKIEAVGRVLVFVGHNCGGLPQPGSPYTVRTQTGWNVRDDGTRETHTGFAFDLQVDQPYCDMLTEVHSRGRVVLTVADMPASMLRGIYESEGVTQSVIYALRVDTKKNRFGYVSIAARTRPFTPGELSKLDVIAARLRATLNLIAPK